MVSEPTDKNADFFAITDLKESGVPACKILREAFELKGMWPCARSICLFQSQMAHRAGSNTDCQPRLPTN
jgi:hypothetical protein